MIGKLVRKLGRITIPKVRWYWLYHYPLLFGTLSTVVAKVIYGKAFTIKKGAKAWGRYRVLILDGGTIRIGERFHCVSDRSRSMTTLFSPVQLTAIGPGEIVIGAHVGLNGTAITAVKKVIIGDDTMIAANTIIVDSDFHRPWPPEARWTSDAEGAAVTIGKQVWIGTNVTILKGVSIGDNSVIAAGSVVVDDIEANCLAGGNPARKIKSYCR